ncbi:hypothetical protein [Streptomyces sp. JV184]|uniref:hypothetical protein n=1 Tax=Streptomyces sp. JV184 TaxID=858637 RepID=UPI002E79BDAC|nr:hypothetical protein [Streptomyces sp. JV184]MEE1750657.1 hypothetical protein [Streptomyces sp. JV184]
MAREVALGFLSSSARVHGYASKSTYVIEDGQILVLCDQYSMTIGHFRSFYGINFVFPTWRVSMGSMDSPDGLAWEREGLKGALDLSGSGLGKSGDLMGRNSG